MERRKFLKTMAGVAVSAVALPYLEVPKLFASISNSTVYDDGIPLNHGAVDFTDNFFKYLKNHPNHVEFPYTRVYTPSFIVDCNTLKVVPSGKAGDIPLLVQTRKLKVSPNWDVKNDRDKQEMMDLTFDFIVTEMNIEYQSYLKSPSFYVEHPYNNPVAMFYIKNLMTTALIYEPDTFTPRRGCMIRYARLHESML